QFALPVETYDLAACPEPGVNGKDVFSAQRRGKQELSEIFDKDPYRFFIRPLLDGQTNLALHGEAQQSFVTVMNSHLHLLRCLAAIFYENRLQQGERLVFRRQYAVDEKLFALA